MKISVIIPVYNAEMFLNKCVNSILNQSFQDFEVILVNDGSKDCSDRICNAISLKESRVHVIHQENKGVSAARNAGLKRARGEWVYFVDADDYLQVNAFDIFFKDIEVSKTDIIRFGLNKLYINGDIKTDKPHENKLFNDLDDFYSRSFFHVYTLCVNYFRRSIITDNSISFTENVKYAEDLEFTTKCFLLSNNILTLNKAFYNYNIHENSAMSKDVSVSSILDHSIVLENIVDFVLKNHRKINSKLFLKNRLFYFMKSFLSRISIQNRWYSQINMYQKKYRVMFSKAKTVLGSELSPFFLINKISIIPFVLYAVYINKINFLKSKKR